MAKGLTIFNTKKQKRIMKIITTANIKTPQKTKNKPTHQKQTNNKITGLPVILMNINVDIP